MIVLLLHEQRTCRPTTFNSRDFTSSPSDQARHDGVMRTIIELWGFSREDKWVLGLSVTRNGYVESLRDQGWYARTIRVGWGYNGWTAHIIRNDDTETVGLGARRRFFNPRVVRLPKLAGRVLAWLVVR